MEMAMEKPVGILSVKVVKGMNLKKKHQFGTSDSYVKLNLCEERFKFKKTSVRHKNLNPEWNEEFDFVIKDPESQTLELHVYGWEKVGLHDEMGLNIIPLKVLVPEEPKTMTLNLVKTVNPDDLQNEKSRGQLVVVLNYKPFKDSDEINDLEDPNMATEGTSNGGGLLVVVIHEAEDLEGKNLNDLSVRLLFRGKEKRTKAVKKSIDTAWGDDFEFKLDEPPIDDKIHVELINSSKRMNLIHKKETLGYADIYLANVVNDKQINEWYHLTGLKNGRIRIEIQWRVASVSN